MARRLTCECGRGIIAVTANHKYKGAIYHAITVVTPRLTNFNILIERHTSELNETLANMKLIKGERAKAAIAQETQGNIEDRRWSKDTLYDC
jgi:hypothetical protein